MEKKQTTDKEFDQESNPKPSANRTGLGPEDTGTGLLRSFSQKTTFRNPHPIPRLKNRIVEDELLNSHRDLNSHFRKVNNELLIGGRYEGNIVVRGDYVFDFSFLAEWFNTLKPLKSIPLKPSMFTKKFIGTAPNSATNQRSYHTMTKTEALGRLVYCGFKIIKTEEHNNVLSFEARKTGLPGSHITRASSPFFKANRVGKNGKDITVYKLRTMHPYAEFLQSYVYEQNNLDVGGKFKADFRISKRGKFLRKYFLDEIPMLWNLIKGDIKLVGVRPISRHYLSLYDKDFQSIRNKNKPGLLPPFYVDFPDSLEKIQVSEQKYLKQYRSNPWLTDTKYLFRILYNILFGKGRSQ